MPMNTFGYNGVLELSEGLANKLLANEAYDLNLVGDGNGDQEFIGPLAISSSATLYLLLGKPLVQFRTHDGTNTVALTVFLSGIGIFTTSGGTTTSVPVGFGTGTGQSFAVRVQTARLNKSGANVSVDFSGVSKADLQFFQTTGSLGPTGVGAISSLAQPLLDADIQRLLPPSVTPDQLRSQLIAQLGQLAQSNAIPIAAGGSNSLLANFDLLLLDNRGAGAAELMLFAADGTGVGVRTDGVDFMPPATPPRQFALSLDAATLIADINTAWDMGAYYKQGESDNTTANPFGFVVVPASGTRTFSLPQGSLASAPPPATIAAPAKGTVTATFTSGSFPGYSRAQLKNLTTSISVAFSADVTGAASASIVAAIGDRIAVELDAISQSSDPTVVIGRPQLQFQDGSVRVTFHYYKQEPLGVVIDENAHIDFAFAADLTQPFGLSASVVGYDISVPWWAYLVEIVGSLLVFGWGIWTIVIGAILAAVTKPIANAVVGSQIGQSAGSVSDQLNQDLAQVAPQGLPLFLEQVDVYANGLVFSGRADAGQLDGGARTQVNVTAGRYLIGSTLFTWTLTGFTCALVFVGRAAAAAIPAGDTALSFFWRATFDDLPAASAFTQNGTNSLQAGATIMLWVDLGEGVFAKVLVSWPFLLGLSPGPWLAFTWIAYLPRLSPTLVVVNNVKATAVSVVGTGIIVRTANKWDGTVDVQTKKFFLTSETQQATPAMEQWFWDGTLLPAPPGMLTLPGGSVKIDRSQRRLLVHLDQSGRADVSQLPPGHTVRFQATDVFGLQMTAETNVPTPAFTTTVSNSGSSGGAGGAGGFINPLGPDIASVLGLLESTLQLLQLSLAQAQTGVAERTITTSTRTEGS